MSLSNIQKKNHECIRTFWSEFYFLGINALNHSDFSEMGTLFVKFGDRYWIGYPDKIRIFQHTNKTKNNAEIQRKQKKVTKYKFTKAQNINC